MRSQEKHYQELTRKWEDIHQQIKNGQPPNHVEMRELVIELMAYQTHHDPGEWVNAMVLSDLVRWFDLQIHAEPPESSGLKDRRISDYHKTRYWLVRDLVAAGVTGRKPGDFPMTACSKAALILRYLDHPAGRARGGAGGWVNARTIKQSCQHATDAADAWALDDDDLHRIEVSPGLIAAVSE